MIGIEWKLKIKGWEELPESQKSEILGFIIKEIEFTRELSGQMGVDEPSPTHRRSHTKRLQATCCKCGRTYSRKEEDFPCPDCGDTFKVW